MRLHTKLTASEVTRALGNVKAAGRITPDVRFVVFTASNSRTHEHAFEIQLGTHDKHSLPEGAVDQRGKKMRVRRYKNSGTGGAYSDGYWGNSHESIYSATWWEWGWLMRALYDLDPDARWGGLSQYGWGYRNVNDFHVKTDHKFSK